MTDEIQNSDPEPRKGKRRSNVQMRLQSNFNPEYLKLASPDGDRRSRFRVLANSNSVNNCDTLLGLTKEEGTPVNTSNSVLNTSMPARPNNRKPIITKNRRKTFSAPALLCADALHNTLVQESSTDGIKIRSNLCPYGIFKDELLASRSLGTQSNACSSIINDVIFYSVVDEEWMEGDIAWGRIGKHPFWPCMITADPTTGSFLRIGENKGGTPIKFFHVRFFGDNGRRSELKSHALLPYSSVEDFHNRAEDQIYEAKSKSQKQPNPFVVPSQKICDWETAVKEADKVMAQPYMQRLCFFDNMSEEGLDTSNESNRSMKQADNVSSLVSSTNSERLKSAIITRPIKRRRLLRRVRFDKDISESNTVDDQAVVSNSRSSPLPSTSADLEPPNNFETTNNSEISTRASPNMNSILSEPSNGKKESIVSETATRHSLDSGADNSIEYPVNGIKEKMKVEKVTRRSLRPLAHLEDFNDPKSPSDKFKSNPKRNSRSSLNADNSTVSESKITVNNGEKPSYMIASTSSAHQSPSGSDNTHANDHRNSKKRSSRDSDITIYNLDELSHKQSIFKKKCLDDVKSRSEFSDTSDSICEFEVRKEHNKQESLRKTKSLLFRGLCRERVCPVCEKPGNLLKCKGVCGNHYHFKCVSQSQNVESENHVNSIDLNVFEQLAMKYMETEMSAAMQQSCSSQQNYLTDKLIGDEVGCQIVEIGKADVAQNTSPLPIPRIELKCDDCSNNRKPKCFICHAENYLDTNSERHRCCSSQCGNFFHVECLKNFPQTKINSGSTSSKKSESIVDTFTCPHHVCHTCVSDNPRGNKSRFLNDQLSKCIRCPTAYHTSIHCIPAGTVLLTSSQIICVKHFDNTVSTKQKTKAKPAAHLNVSWCFICATGGSLICCETCPTAFHLECLSIPHPEGGYICEDCEAGRYPLYDEVVWCKMSYYRWWPARVLPPYEVPEKLFKAVDPGGFCVRFFGTFDHHWTNRARVFLYNEADSATPQKNNGTHLDNLFVKSVAEAGVAVVEFKRLKALHKEKVERDLKPPYYIKIKTNRLVGNVKAADGDVSLITPCDCDPSIPFPCGPQTRCLNRMLQMECNPDICPAGDMCCNQSFEKRLYPLLTPYKTEARGWGLKTLADITPGEFIIEYVGDMIDNSEFKRRIARKNEEKDENYYFLTLDKDRIIDAGPKGNMARFINHSCDPNCETQKWTVNGDLRVGLFAKNFIQSGTELTFNYNMTVTGGKKKCFCGTAKCSGFIGAKRVVRTKLNNK